jgi:BirA family biotin operon repressor/biotin-[acetyl-CoA-carboxylase] ligase
MNFEVRRFDRLDSTNRYLLDAARGGAPEGVVAVTDYQTAGRGRRGRAWDAPPGASLLVSILLRPLLLPERVQLVTMAAGIAMRDAVEHVAAFAAALKWPNDLVVGDRKLAGLLGEADVDSGGMVSAAVIGAGVNVNWDELPPDLIGTATSCSLECGHPVDRETLLAAFLSRFGDRYAALHAVPTEYRRHLATLGRRVRVERAEGDVVGRAVDVGAAGELLVALDTGRVVEVHSGDVNHLRDV